MDKIRERRRLASPSATWGPHDGLQNEPDAIPPTTRAELVTRLAAGRFWLESLLGRRLPGQLYPAGPFPAV